MTEQEQIEFERNEIAEIISNSFDHNGEKWDASDFEWSAHRVQMAGYRKQTEGEWVKHEHDFWGVYYTCSACKCDVARAKKYQFCPECGAKMKGGAE